MLDLERETARKVFSLIRETPTGTALYLSASRELGAFLSQQKDAGRQRICLAEISRLVNFFLKQKHEAVARELAGILLQLGRLLKLSSQA